MRGWSAERAWRFIEQWPFDEWTISPPNWRSQQKVSTNPVANRFGDLLLAGVLVFSAHLRGAEPCAIVRAQLGPERDLDLGFGAVDSNAVACRTAGARDGFDVGPLRVAVDDVEVFVEDVFLNGLRTQGRGDVQRRLERGIWSRRGASASREHDECGGDCVDRFHALQIGTNAWVNRW